jgi:hypothetical protein
MWRMDYAIARLSQIVLSAAGMKGSNGKVATVSELMPFTDEPVATEEDMKRMFGIKD